MTEQDLIQMLAAGEVDSGFMANGSRPDFYCLSALPNDLKGSL